MEQRVAGKDAVRADDEGQEHERAEVEDRDAPVYDFTDYAAGAS